MSKRCEAALYVSQSTGPTASTLARARLAKPRPPEAGPGADRQCGRAVDWPACTPVGTAREAIRGVTFARGSRCTPVLLEPAQPSEPSAEAAWRAPGRPRPVLTAGRCRGGPVDWAGGALVHRTGRPNLDQLWRWLGRAHLGRCRLLLRGWARTAPEMHAVVGGVMSPRSGRRRWPEVGLMPAGAVQ